MKPTNNIEHNTLTDLEKKQLKHRIKKSVIHFNSRKKRWRYAYAMAACIAVLFCVRVYFNNSANESLIKYVETSGKVNVNDTNEVVLILNNKENINIDEESAEISYSATGEKVDLGQSKTLSQDVDDEEINYNTLLVPYGKRTQLKLSDGSMVWLNSGSKLIYPAKFKGSTRELYLEGEAIFDVAHNAERPFIVQLSKDNAVEVLGTVFNVSNYPEDDLVQTTLKSGSVKIKYADNSLKNSFKYLRITPGTMAEFDKKQATIMSKPVDITPYFSWKEGILIFKQDYLITIFKKLSRYYNVKIEPSGNGVKMNAGNDTFSGSLDLKDNIKEVLDLIKETTNFNYTIEGNKISIN
ncbi:FecR family protein [Snuella sedimenti]|uniref:FecR domain-containing protein n=1 Tax=Snuella sedimenti TaxID=2798802 RepID=A0A8J7J646_9FLAO|nr:FecR domain-containing protein [Snuella sedimenti]MBJ6369608.1 FecR domain-containing protein [Snuella sedimenti]